MVETITETREIITDIKDKTANPTPLGFTGLGLSAILLSLSYIGLYPVDSMIVSMAIFLGRVCPGLCRNYGLEERRYFWRNRILCLWPFLVLPCQSFTPT